MPACGGACASAGRAFSDEITRSSIHANPRNAAYIASPVDAIPAAVGHHPPHTPLAVAAGAFSNQHARFPPSRAVSSRLAIGANPAVTCHRPPDTLAVAAGIF